MNKTIGEIPTKEELEEIFAEKGATLPIKSENRNRSVLTGTVIEYHTEDDQVVIKCESIRMPDGQVYPLNEQSTRKREEVTYA